MTSLPSAAGNQILQGMNGRRSLHRGCAGIRSSDPDRNVLDSGEYPERTTLGFAGEICSFRRSRSCPARHRAMMFSTTPATGRNRYLGLGEKGKQKSRHKRQQEEVGKSFAHGG